VQVSASVTSAWKDALSKNGFSAEMKLDLYATGANSMLMRIENLADTFDSNGKVIHQSVDVQGLAESLFAIANN
jgi:hypothetical protein